MTPEQLKTDITGWCNDKTGLQLVEDRSEAGGALALGLRARGSAGGSVPVDVRLEQDDDRVTIRSSGTAAAGKDVDDLLATRPALVRSETGGGATITAYVYLDGLTQHSFITAVEEVAKTRGLIDGLGTATSSTWTQVDAVAATPAYTPAQSTPEPATPAQPWAASTLPRESVQPATSSLPAPSFATPAASYTPQPAQPVFAPTHTVPPQGMQAWAAPDPNGAVVATLGGGLPIQVTEVRGAWANIVCSNGWTGWVDGRIIGVAR